MGHQLYEYSIIPLDLHTNKRGLVKATISVVAKLKKHDHRQKEKEKEHKKEINQYGS
jgi:tmRNA-binding protein